MWLRLRRRIRTNLRRLKEGDDPSLPPPRGPWWKRVSIRMSRVLHANHDPRMVAGGMALGVGIGVAPTFGLGVLLVAGLAVFFRFNLPSAVLGSLAGIPPVMLVFWWPLSAWVGAHLLGIEWEPLYAKLQHGGLKEVGGQMVWAYLAGNVVVTLAASVLTYLAVYWFMQYRRTRRLKSVR